MTSFVRNKQIVSADMDGELVMMSVDKGQYYGLGGIGPRIWEMLAEPVDRAQLVSAITSEYEVDEQECARDVDAFLQLLLKDNLISEV